MLIWIQREFGGALRKHLLQFTLLTALPAKPDIFARFITTREKRILARVIGIRKES